MADAADAAKGDAEDEATAIADAAKGDTKEKAMADAADAAKGDAKAVVSRLVTIKGKGSQVMAGSLVMVFFDEEEDDEDEKYEPKDED